VNFDELNLDRRLLAGVEALVLWPISSVTDGFEPHAANCS
jgi:hypothetical protein